MDRMSNFNHLAQYATSGSNSGGSPAVVIFYIALLVIFVAGTWKTYQKAGQPGWAAIIPIYNLVILCRIVKEPIWWVIFLCIPLINIIPYAYFSGRVAKAFGKGTGTAILLYFSIGYLFTGFGAAKYQPKLLENK